jgi:PGF-pre-PGF domain-containing protein
MVEREVKRKFVFGFVIFLAVFSIIFFLGNLPLTGNVSSNVTEDLNPLGWIGTSQLYSVVCSSVDNLVYLVGSSGVFGAYNRNSGVIEDLRGSDPGNWIGSAITDVPMALTYDSKNNLVYMVGFNKVFGVYNRTSNVTENLKGTASWMASDSILYDVVSGSNDTVYLVGQSGIFGVYNRTSNVTENLMNSDTGNWMGTNYTTALTYDSNNSLIYFGGQGGTFGVYNRSSNVASNLTATDTNDWIGTRYINALAYDSSKRLVYIGGAEGIFGVYNRTSNVATDLRGTDPDDWFGTTYEVNVLTYNPNNKLIYLGSSALGKFGAYNWTSNVTQDIRQNDTWFGKASLYGLTYDSNSSLVYFAGHTGSGTSGIFGSYNSSSNLTTNLRAAITNDWVATTDLKGLAIDSRNGRVYLVGNDGLFGVYNQTSGVIQNLRTTDTGNWIAYSNLLASVYDSNNNLIYVGGDDGFGVYNISLNVTTNLTATDYGGWYGGYLSGIYNLAFDSNESLVYLVGNAGLFGVYNITSNFTIDLTSTDPGNWISSRSIYGIDYDPNHKLVYFSGGGPNGFFGVYDRISNVAENLTGFDSLYIFYNSIIYSVAYDTKNNLVYLSGSLGKLGVYDRTTNLTSDLSSTDPDDWIGQASILDMAYDSSEDLVYFVGETASATSGVFGVYNLTSNITENLNGTDTGDWIGVNRLKRVKYNPIDGLIYLAGNSGIFGAYNRSSNITTIVEQVISIEETVGGTPPAKTTTVNIPSIPSGQPATLNITNPNIEVGSVTISTNENVSSVSVTVTEVPKTKVGDFVIGISAGGAGIYQALNITARGLNNSQIESASINFRVNISWIEQQRKATEGDIHLFRRNDITNKWEALNTTYLYNDSQFYYYTAITPGFSTFVIYFGRYECEPGIRRCFESQIQMCLGNATWLVTEKCAYGCDEQGVCLEKPLSNFDLKILYFVVGVVVFVLIVVFLLRRVPVGKNKSSREVRAGLHHRQSFHRQG